MSTSGIGDAIEADKGKTLDEYIEGNPVVWELFQEYARQWQHAGHLICSARMLFHRIRWQSGLMKRGKAFKVNNNYSKKMAKKFIADNTDIPEHFFEFREAAANKQAGDTDWPIE